MNRVSTKTQNLNSPVSSQSFDWKEQIRSFDNAQYDDESILDAEIIYDSTFKKRVVFNCSNTIAQTSSTHDDLLNINQNNEVPSSRNDGGKLSNLYVYRDYFAVKNYLMINLQLGSLLFESYQKLVQYFGLDVRLLLELKTDIYEPEFKQLFIRIISNKNISEGLKLLDKFEHEWWFERTAFIANSPVITLE